MYLINWFLYSAGDSDAFRMRNVDNLCSNGLKMSRPIQPAAHIKAASNCDKTRWFKFLVRALNDFECERVSSPHCSRRPDFLSPGPGDASSDGGLMDRRQLECWHNVARVTRNSLPRLKTWHRSTLNIPGTRIGTPGCRLSKRQWHFLPVTLARPSISELIKSCLERWSSKLAFLKILQVNRFVTNPRNLQPRTFP